MRTARLVRRRLSGRVFAAEESLVEGVDSGVQGAQFLADFGQVLAQVLVSGVYVLADSGDGTPKAQTNPQYRNDDGDGACVHGVHSTTLTRTKDQ